MSDESKDTKVPGEQAGADKGHEQQQQEQQQEPASALLQGTDIAQVLKGAGPIVKCVLLKHIRHDGKDGKPHAASGHVDKEHKRQVFTELVEEIQVDTTPSKSGVKQILGGPFTFLGQYPEEGVVVMARKELPTDLETQSIASLRTLCQDHNVDTTGILEKNELVQALLESQLPINPHNLQPPLDGIVVRGDILIMKIAETDEVLDTSDNDDDDKNVNDKNDNKKQAAGKKEVKVLTNEEFFLNYTKEEWVAFASRTDVKAPEPEEADDDEEEDDEEEEEGDEDDGDDDDDADDGHEAVFNLEDADEEDRHAMLNLVLGEVLRNFRHEHGRGPDTRELLELRSQIAKELKVEVTTLEALENNNKRSAEDALAEHHSPKKVKFSAEAVAAADVAAEGTATAAASSSKNDDGDDSDKKPAAKESAKEKDGDERPGDDDDSQKPAADKEEKK